MITKIKGNVDFKYTRFNFNCIILAICLLCLITNYDWSIILYFLFCFYIPLFILSLILDISLSCLHGGKNDN